MAQNWLRTEQKSPSHSVQHDHCSARAALTSIHLRIFNFANLRRPTLRLPKIFLYPNGQWSSRRSLCVLALGHQMLQGTPFMAMLAVPLHTHRIVKGTIESIWFVGAASITLACTTVKRTSFSVIFRPLSLIRRRLSNNMFTEQIRENC